MSNNSSATPEECPVLLEPFLLRLKVTDKEEIYYFEFAVISKWFAERKISNPLTGLPFSADTKFTLSKSHFLRHFHSNGCLCNTCMNWRESVPSTLAAHYSYIHGKLLVASRTCAEHFYNAWQSKFAHLVNNFPHLHSTILKEHQNAALRAAVAATARQERFHNLSQEEQDIEAQEQAAALAAVARLLANERAPPRLQEDVDFATAIQLSLQEESPAQRELRETTEALEVSLAETEEFFELEEPADDLEDLDPEDLQTAIALSLHSPQLSLVKIDQPASVYQILSANKIPITAGLVASIVAATISYAF